MDHLDTFHNIADRYPDKAAILDHSGDCVHTIDGDMRKDVHHIEGPGSITEKENTGSHQDLEEQSAQTFQLQEDIPRSGRRSAQHAGTGRVRGRSYARDGPVKPDTREDRLCPDVHIERRPLYRTTFYQCMDRCPLLPHVQRSISRWIHLGGYIKSARCRAASPASKSRRSVHLTVYAGLHRHAPLGHAGAWQYGGV